jgi:16S rRNA (cytosine967-C5)-methyltransferase
VTCSILPAENSAVVAAFLGAREDATEQQMTLRGSENCPHGQQLLPSVAGPDGLYFAMLRKAN